jgi:hypothetical protein
MRKKTQGFLIAIFALLFAVTLSACGTNNVKEISEEEAKTIAEDFINEYLMMDETQAVATNDGEEYGLYKMSIDIGYEEAVESYISKDGTLFFPQALNIEEIKREGDAALDGETPPEVDVPQSEKPTVEMFIMTHCPYGTQMQKGILPVVKLLGDKIDFQQKYVDYAMHEKLELDENLLQYCINKEAPNDFYNYLDCFLIEGDSDKCLSENVSNQTAINTCIANTDQEFKVTENYDNKIGFRGTFPGFDVDKISVEKYNVGGSPTLIINETEVPAWRDPASLLKIVCDAFVEKPAECDVPLPSEAPSPGFGYGTGANVDASCG